MQGWDAFTEYEVAPLTLDGALELVGKIPFDAKTKEQFVRDMRERLFAEHKSFLSNPLLLSIMLLTYSDIAHIPQKLSTFYGQAYEALFHRHDALKSGFQRERQSGLDVQDFAIAFAAFSVLSYDGGEFSFTRTRALELSGKARKAAMVNRNDDAFIDDAIQAVCLLVEDGLQLSFAHRSFQEYFVARFIQTSPPEVKAKLVSRFGSRAESDAVIKLLWEMDTYIVEKHYLLPKLAELRVAVGVKRRAGLVHLRRYLCAIMSEILIVQSRESRVTGIPNDERLLTAVVFALSHYRDWPLVDIDDEEKEQASESALVAAFKADFGTADRIAVRDIKVNRKFLPAVAKHGYIWSLESLQNLIDIENEIRSKHENNLESLETLLSTPIAKKRAD